MKLRSSSRAVSLALTAAVAAAVTTAAAPAVAAPVSVYPSPGARTAAPGSQISFRGVAPGAIGPLEVVGSRSGRHAGRLAAHSDGQGASFLPDEPFAPGETVSVRTRLEVTGARAGDWRLTIATPGPRLRPPRVLPVIDSGPGVQRFHSRHDLAPPTVTVKRAAKGTAPGDIFLGTLSAPFQHGPGQAGPMLLDAHGRLVWFHPLHGDQIALDVRAQTYDGQPVVTWWQGFNNVGLGNGVGMIYDSSYRRIAVVRAGNGLPMDLHEFLLTPRGTALVAAENPIVWDTSSVHGARKAVVYDDVVQEIDVKTGLVLFEWHSLDHVALSESHARFVRVDGHLDDYFHINSIAETSTGDVLVSARNTWAAYKIDRASGDVEWQLGGSGSSFRAADGAAFSWQHDARVAPDGAITLFDDGPSPGTGSQSRAIALRIDTHRRTARLLRDYRHTPKLLAGTQGNQQSLPGGNVFVGWGSQPVFSEYAPHGRLLFDATLPRGVESYRAYRFPWNPAPTTLPAVAASTDGRGGARAYASWNGAGNVARWQLLGGPDADHLAPLGAPVATRGFETAFAEKTDDVAFAVQALDAGGRLLATSKAVTAGTS